MEIDILLIDDDPDVHIDVKFSLAGIKGLKFVAFCLSVDEALSYFDSHPGKVKVILCDIRMPGKNGYDAYRLLNGFCKVFFFLTGITKHGNEVGTTGAMGYINKPVEKDVVESRLKQVEALLREDEADVWPDAWDLLFLKGGENNKYLIPVRVTDIHRIEIDANYATIIMGDSRQRFTAHVSLARIYRKLQKTGLFARVQKSTLISYHGIDRIELPAFIICHDGKKIGVGDRYKAAYREFCHKFGVE